MKYVFRRLLRAPAFTGLAILTLAIGIGATAAVFSVINGVLLKPLPFREPDRLVGLWHSAAGLGDSMKEIEMCPSLYFTYRELGKSFEDVGLYTSGTASVTGAGRPEQEEALWINWTTLPVLGVKPFLGRALTEKDDTEGAPSTALVTYGYWQRKFGGTASIVGRHIIVDGRDREIIGVLPKDFRFMNDDPALLLPLRFDRNKTHLGNFSYRGVARLKPGVTMQQANADIARMIPVSFTMFPAPEGASVQLFIDAKFGAGLRPFSQDVVGDVSGALWVIMGTIAGVLLIACANVANLLLVRAEGRQHELSIRTALGAGRGSIAKDLLMESVTLGIMGGVLGLAFAYGAVRLLISMAPAKLPRLAEIGIDPIVVVFTLAVSLLSGLLFGVLPAFRYGGAKMRLRESGRALSHSKERLRARNILVVVQVALALVLLIGSGLMIRTFQALHAVFPGFRNPQEVLTMRASIQENEIKEPEAVMRAFQKIADGLAALPGVKAVAIGNGAPMDGNSSGDPLYAETQYTPPGKVPPIRRMKFIAPGYFSTTGNTLVAGRDFTWTDLYSLRPVVMVAENMAKEVWGSPASALGKRVRESTKGEWREVVGVVGDTHENGIEKPVTAMVYFPALRHNIWGNEVEVSHGVTFLVRSQRTGSPEFLEQLQKVIWATAPNTPVAGVKTLDEIYRKSMARTSFTLVMLAIAGVMAMILGLIGIYDAISYSVTQRTREIGIRMALGARQGQVRGMFIRSGLGLAGVGVVCGLVAAAGLTQLMKSLLFGVAAADPITWVAMAGAMVLAALAASYVPARRATAVDPVNTLRAE